MFAITFPHRTAAARHDATSPRTCPCASEASRRPSLNAQRYWPVRANALAPRRGDCLRRTRPLRLSDTVRAGKIARERSAATFFFRGAARGRLSHHVRARRPRNSILDRCWGKVAQPLQMRERCAQDDPPDRARDCSSGGFFREDVGSQGQRRAQRGRLTKFPFCSRAASGIICG